MALKERKTRRAFRVALTNFNTNSSYAGVGGTRRAAFSNAVRVGSRLLLHHGVDDEKRWEDCFAECCERQDAGGGYDWHIRRAIGLVGEHRQRGPYGKGIKVEVWRTR